MRKDEPKARLLPGLLLKREFWRGEIIHLINIKLKTYIF
jgi:hypothetical protein